MTKLDENWGRVILIWEDGYREERYIKQNICGIKYNGKRYSSYILEPNVFIFTKDESRIFLGWLKILNDGLMRR